MDRLVTEHNAGNIFNHKETYPFLKKGGTKTTSLGTKDVARPDLCFVANKVINNNGTMISQGTIDKAPKLSLLLVDYDKTTGDMDIVDPAKAMEMVEKADKEVAARNAMAHTAQRTY
jgi:hypothetical protein